jgi:hypothetical protein
VHIGRFEEYRSGSRLFFDKKQAQHSGLPRSGMTDDGNEFARLDTERHLMQRSMIGIELRDLVEIYH